MFFTYLFFAFITGDKKNITHDQVSSMIRYPDLVTAMNLFVCLTLLLAALVITDVKGMINLYFFVFINSIPFSSLEISSLTARDGP